jgi:hypothetical protein
MNMFTRRFCIALSAALLAVLCAPALPSQASPAAVFDALYPTPLWSGHSSAGYDVTVENNTVAITNKRIDSTDNIGWPGIRAAVDWTVNLNETPYLFLDVFVPTDIVSPRWNMIIYTNEYPDGLELGPAFSDGGFMNDVWGPQTVRFDLTSTPLTSYRTHRSGSDVILSGTVHIEGIDIVAVTDRYNTVTFRQIYISGDRKPGDTNSYGGISKFRAGARSGYLMPTVRRGMEPELRFTRENHVRDDSAERLAALPFVSNAAAVFGSGSADIAFTAYSSVSDVTDIRLFTAMPLPVSGTVIHDSGEIRMTAAETGALTSQNGSITTEASSVKPVHEFTVDVNGYSGDVVLAYQGGTRKGERVRFSVFNAGTGQWEIAATREAELTASVRVNTSYAENGVIRAKAELVLVGNGADTFIWMTDTQHYPFFRKLVEEEIYKSMTRYAAEEFTAGRIAYVAHTGDIVENDNLLEWPHAAAAHDYLEAAGVPNGVVSGNHDVGNPTRRNLYHAGNYINFETFFGAWRYENSDWYGWHDDENVHHYDLITIGEYDFVFIYLGMGREASEETAAWVTEVCEKYAHRNIVLLLHQYLSHTGVDYVISYGGTNRPVGQDVYDRIVEPNPGIRMVLCGHSSGAAWRFVERPDGSRVLEMLHDYQTVDISLLQESTNTYWRSNGDGFLRLMTFAGNQLIYRTYSPYLDKWNAFHPDIDSGTIDIELLPAERHLTTTAFSAVAIDTSVLETEIVNYASGTAVEKTLSLNSGEGWFVQVTDAEGRVFYSPLMTDEFIESGEPGQNWLIRVVIFLLSAAAAGIVTVAVKRRMRRK